MGIRHSLEFMDDLLENDMLTPEYITKYVMRAYSKPEFLPEEYEAMQDMFDNDIADYWERQMAGIEEPEDMPVPNGVANILRYFIVKSGARKHGYPDNDFKSIPLECYRWVEDIIGLGGMKELGIYEEMLSKTVEPLPYVRGRYNYTSEQEVSQYDDRGDTANVSHSSNSNPFDEPFPMFPEMAGQARNPFDDVPGMGNYGRFEAYDPFIVPFPDLRSYEAA